MWLLGVPATRYVRRKALFRGNHLSNDTCITQMFFKSGESFCDLR